MGGGHYIQQHHIIGILGLLDQLAVFQQFIRINGFQDVILGPVVIESQKMNAGGQPVDF